VKITPAKKQIIDDAVSAGYAREDGEFSVDLVKLSKHKKPRVLAGLRIYQDGTAVRLDIDLSIAIGIRSHAGMRAVLGI
jgi:hypothetical protein